MWLHRVVFIVSACIGFSKAYKYKAVPDDEELFNECEDQPSNILGIKGLFDFSELTFKMVNESLSISGNVTTNWDIQPTDRIQVTGRLLQYDRGIWQPTVYSIIVVDFCSVMYDKKQIWYTFFFTHVTNQNEIMDKCVNVVGTKFQYETFDLLVIFESYLKLHGHLKVEFKLLAFDQFNRIRPTSICVETKG